jgi:hypothetical protein
VAVSVDLVAKALLRFRNVVLEGAPGTGKTFAAGQLAAQWENLTGRQLAPDLASVHAITMHPSTAYEDFIEGLRYDEAAGAFIRRDGFMKRVVDAALADPDRDYLILLDELNRSNIPKVLGDLLLTLERSKRCRWNGTDWVGGVAVTLPYSGAPFRMPENVYVLGTMNTSDRSIAPLDLALRRRFAFVYCRPLADAELLATISELQGAEVADALESSVEMLSRLNREVLEPVLGPDGLLGHSYLLDLPAGPSGPLSWLVCPDTERAFWTEARSGNGGSRNQFDLADQGFDGQPGSASLFYPMVTPGGVQAALDPTRQRTDDFTICTEGREFPGNQLRWNEPTPGWRVYLQGTDPDGRLSAIASQVVGAPDHDGARFFEYRLLVWRVDSEGRYHLRRMDATDENIALLRSCSQWTSRTQRGAAGREYGPLDLDAVSGMGGLAEGEPALTWRYAILPQLVELANAHGVEDLFDPQHRADWLSAHGSPVAPEALEAFDTFIHGFSASLAVMGHGLGRALSIVDGPRGA